VKCLNLVVCLLVACGGSQSGDHRSVSSPPPGNPDIAAVQPSGNVSCAQEIALECPSGVDGCLKGLTSVHICVSQTAQAGPSCSQEIALSCASGEVDACTLSPTVATTHVCVQR
jgi:hypothetical protein